MPDVTYAAQKNHRTPLWHLNDIANAISGYVVCPKSMKNKSISKKGDIGICGVAFDSRHIQSGDLFFALKGDVRDGHQYIESALKKGACAAVVAESALEGLGEAHIAPLVVVQDTLEALWHLARGARKRQKHTTFIAITGSAGKTGTKEALTTLLNHLHTKAGDTIEAFKTPASFNNHIGVPLSLSNMPRNTTHGVFELGMNHKGEIEKLATLLKPHIALITTVGMAHIEAFGNVQGIAAAKAEIFTCMHEHKFGIAILPRDNPFFAFLRDTAKKCGVMRIITFGCHENADIRLENTTQGICPKTKEMGLHFKATVSADSTHLKGFLPGAGVHDVQNMMAVFAALYALELDLKCACMHLASLTPSEGRGALKHVYLTKTCPVTIVDSSYNANPLSMKAAIEALSFASSENGRKVVILGDMLELGTFEEKAHKDLLAPLQVAGIDKVILVGKRMEHLWRILPAHLKGAIFQDTKALLKANLQTMLKPHDTILVKGSNSIGLKAWIEDLQQNCAQQ